MTDRIDWQGIAGDVVERLLGAPNAKLSRGNKLRYGNRGSLAVDLDKAAWFDHEAGRGGGISKLIERELGCDWKGARRWLEREGYIASWAPSGRRRAAGGGTAGPTPGNAGRTSPARDDGPVRDDAAVAADEARRIGLARSLWAARVPVPSGSPVMAYLADRGTWPHWRGFGPDWPWLPPAMGWVPRQAIDDVAQWLPDFPAADAAGALVAGYVNVLDRRDLRAVSLDALTAHGARPAGPRWRRTPGVLRGAAVVVPARQGGRQVAIVEGECDALAVALMARGGLHGLGDVGEVRCVGGTSGFQPDRCADVHGRPVLCLPDAVGRDGKATAAALAVECASRLRAEGRAAYVRFRPAGDGDGDPAGDLAALLIERTARFEREGPDMGAEQARAERLAWRAILGLTTDGG